MGYFKDVTPESVGISSKGIMKFLDRMEQNQIELHSFMVIRHGQCAAKGWWKPYDEKFRHPLYSFSKSLTATAIGFAQQEGILSVDEKIVDIFPELLPEHPSEYLKKITLHHLLIMGCGHETEISDNSENWISTFLHHPVLHEPGTFYKYNTAGTNMLAAVLRRKTGQNVTEFLKPRLLEPLGITSLTCALLGDGTELGGGGMKMVTEDMAKFTYFLSRQGEWEGKQLLRKEWFERACHKQIETEGDSEGHVKDWLRLSVLDGPISWLFPRGWSVWPVWGCVPGSRFDCDFDVIHRADTGGIERTAGGSDSLCTERGWRAGTITACRNCKRVYCTACSSTTQRNEKSFYGGKSK